MRLGATGNGGPCRAAGHMQDAQAVHTETRMQVKIRLKFGQCMQLAKTLSHTLEKHANFNFFLQIAVDCPCSFLVSSLGVLVSPQTTVASLLVFRVPAAQTSTLKRCPPLPRAPPSTTTPLPAPTTPSLQQLPGVLPPTQHQTAYCALVLQLLYIELHQQTTSAVDMIPAILHL